MLTYNILRSTTRSRLFSVDFTSHIAYTFTPPITCDACDLKVLGTQTLDDENVTS